MLMKLEGDTLEKQHEVGFARCDIYDRLDHILYEQLD
jgi:hypothetical protein